MSIVSAYTEINKDSNFHWGSDELAQEGSFHGKSPEGIEVDWGFPEPPKSAQVYLYWEPKVVAIWEEEEIEDEYGIEVEQPGQGDSEEADDGAGQGGEGVGEGQAPGPEESISAE